MTSPVAYVLPLNLSNGATLCKSQLSYAGFKVLYRPKVVRFI